MPTRVTRRKASEHIEVDALNMDSVHVRLIGRTGLYLHRLSAKAKRELFVGGKRKTVADKRKIKHHPIEEFRESLHFQKNLHPHTHLFFPAMGFKAGMATAALVVSGINKTDVQRLVYIPEEKAPIFGVPRMRLDIVRNSGINRTPDIRTRGYLREWGAELTILFAKPALSKKAILTLLHNAGQICGIGDFRQEKGKGAYGTFSVTEDPFPSSLLDRDRQWQMIHDPEPDNDDTEELLKEYFAEIERRA